MAAITAADTGEWRRNQKFVSVSGWRATRACSSLVNGPMTFVHITAGAEIAALAARTITALISVAYTRSRNKLRSWRAGVSSRIRARAIEVTRRCACPPCYRKAKWKCLA